MNFTKKKKKKITEISSYRSFKLSRLSFKEDAAKC